MACWKIHHLVRWCSQQTKPPFMVGILQPATVDDTGESATCAPQLEVAPLVLAHHAEAARQALTLETWRCIRVYPIAGTSLSCHALQTSPSWSLGKSGILDGFQWHHHKIILELLWFVYYYMFFRYELGLTPLFSPCLLLTDQQNMIFHVLEEIYTNG
jgi:hypothetical protein